MKKGNILFLVIVSLFFCTCEHNTDSIIRQKELEYITVDVIDRYFNVGSTFDYSKIKILGHYSDGSVLNEDPSFATLKGFDSSTLKNDLIVTVSINGKLAEFSITIGTPRQKRIWIEKYPKRLIYPEDYNLYDSIDLSYMEVRVELDNGIIETLKSDEYSIDITDIEMMTGSAFNGCNVVTITSLENRNLTTKFNVYKIGDGIITKITALPVPDRKYNIGNTIDFTGVTVNLSVGSKRITIDDGKWYFEKSIVTEEDIITEIHQTYNIWTTLWNWLTGREVKRVLTYSYKLSCKINDQQEEHSFYLEFPITYKSLEKIDVRLKDSAPNIYEGNEIFFTNVLDFFRVYGIEDVEDNQINLNNESDSLGYSTSKKDSFNKVTKITEPYKFDNFGVKRIYFYYLIEGVLYECPYDFFVHDAKMLDIEVFWEGGKTPEPLDIDKLWTKDLLKNANLNVKSVYSNGNKFDIDSYRWTVTYPNPENGKPTYGEGEWGVKDGKIIINYRGDNNTDYKKEIDVPYKKPQPESSPDQ